MDKAHDLLMDEANDYVGGLAMFNGLMAIGVAVFVEPDLGPEVAIGIWIWAGLMACVMLLAALANLSTSWGLKRMRRPPGTAWDAGTPREWIVGSSAVLLILLAVTEVPALALAGSAIGLGSVWAMGRRPEPEARAERMGDRGGAGRTDGEGDRSAGEAAFDEPTP